MTTPRDFLALVDPDHRFNLSMTEDKFQDLAKTLRLSCSCGWKTHRAVSWKEAEDGYSNILTREWMDRERLDHLLDQELDKISIMDLVS